MLLFKKKFLEPIRAGTKTQTLRCWKGCRVRPGRRSYIPGAGYVHIESVEPVELEALSDADAVPDGFETADQLRAELRSLYPDRLGKDYRLYKIVFRLLPPEEQETIIAERERRKSDKKAGASEARDQWFDETMRKLGELAGPRKTGSKTGSKAGSKTGLKAGSTKKRTRRRS